MKFNFLTNKYVFYIIAFLSIINILGYFFNKNYGTIIFFALISFLTFCFTKNFIIILAIALFSTNLLSSLAEIFITPNISVIKVSNKNKEGFINNPENSSENNEDKKVEIDIEGTLLNKHGNTEFQPSLFSENIKDGDLSSDISLKFEKSKDLENKKDFLQTQMTSDNIKEIENKTSDLLKEQDNLMKQIADFGPILNSSLQAIGNVTTGNIGSVISELTENLDSLYSKYPNSFPSNYKEKSSKMKGAINDVKNSVKQEFNNIDTIIKHEKFKNHPNLEKDIIKLKETINI